MEVPCDSFPDIIDPHGDPDKISYISGSGEISVVHEASKLY